MIELEDGYVPIAYATTYRTRFVVSLPEFVDQNQIGVNLSGLEKLMQIGG